MQEKTVRQPIDSMKKENGKDSQGQTSFIVSLFHPRGPNEPTWKYLPLVLALGFIARATVALSTDFVLHPDEIMQYLEPAHLLAFGNGVSYWEYFYGARSWLVPGVVAGVLKLFDLIGLGEPVWYVGGVKLFFCAVSLWFRRECTFSRGDISAKTRLGWRLCPAHSGMNWWPLHTSR